VSGLSVAHHMDLNAPRRMCGVSGFLLSVLMLGSCGATASDPAVARHLETFFEAFVGRQLSADELRETTDEFIELHTLGGKNLEAIRETAQRLSSSVNVLREQDGSPAAFTARHFLLEVNYLNPDMHDTLELRLLNSPDPVRVVDARSRRLMTERDVVALANIRYFAKSERPPRHRPLTRRQIEELVSVLRATVGGNSGNMPRFFGEATAFWAGVQQQWPRLDAEQRSLARAYAGRLWRIQMPVEMYSRLWGLEPQAASSRHAADVSARISAMTDINASLGNLPLMIDSIFGQ
jgi:hypothetical protein